MYHKNQAGFLNHTISIGKYRLRFSDCLFLFVFLFLAVYSFVRAPYGITNSDESLFQLYNYRLMKGDHLFCDDWMIGNLTSVFTYLPYRVYVMLLGGPEGVLLAAVPNRLGIKYLAGAPEESSGKAFGGLAPQAGPGEKPQSREELLTLLKDSGFENVRLYYPYPDTAYPVEIFTDETLETQHYGKPYLSYDGENVRNFRESQVVSALSGEKALASFANAFLAEARIRENPDPERILYVKQNMDRREDFRTGTVILE